MIAAEIDPVQQRSLSRHGTQTLLPHHGIRR